MRKKIVLFGATGSIGKSVLKILDKAKDRFSLNAITCNENISKLNDIALKYNCKNLGIANKTIFSESYKNLNDNNYVFGLNNFDEFITDEIDIYILATAGIDSAELSLKLAETGKILAIANKESIISLGKILIDKCSKNKTQIFPLDSEHNAIYQLLRSQSGTVKDIVITASGGPFLDLPLEKFNHIKPEDAIKHPKWSMGKKISVDSSNLMNKSLEVIEAKNLFNLKSSSIDAIIHPQSIIHGIINFNDNSSFAFLSQPKMEIPISSLFFPDKSNITNDHRLDLKLIKNLEFREIDYNRFPSFKLCQQIMKIDGLAPHLFNYINDKLVNFFLEKKINYINIVEFNEKIIDFYFKSNQNIESPSIIDIKESSVWINQNIKSIINI